MPPTTDPVCGMQVDPKSALAIEYAGETYHFCESACAEIFAEESDRWVPELLRSIPDEALAAPSAAL